jgi:hypothetical protein
VPFAVGLASVVARVGLGKNPLGLAAASGL